jgi:DNA-binding transcriptional regulator YiaG
MLDIPSMEYIPAAHVPLPNAVEAFIQAVRERFSEVRISLEEGGVKAGNWWIDFLLAQESVTIEWRPDKGFGIYDNEGPGYGDRPREVFRDSVLAARRVVQKLETRHRVGLRELREIYSVSQAELASRLGIKQAAVSKFESRSNNINGFKLETLLKLVSSLGGSLEIHAHFPDGDLPILLPEKL